MRSELRALRLGAAAVLMAAVLAGCADADEDASEPSEGERAACEQIQDLVDSVAAGEALTAMDDLAALESALAGSGNEVLATNGAEFFATISDTVPDPGSLTVEETAAVGDRALASAQPRLRALLDECSSVGLAITDLPTGEEQP